MLPCGRVCEALVGLLVDEEIGFSTNTYYTVTLRKSQNCPVPQLLYLKGKQ